MSVRHWGWQTCLDPKILDGGFCKGVHDGYRIIYVDVASSDVGVVLIFKHFELQFTTLQGV